MLHWRVRRLIINCDDFGLTCGVNRAIIKAHHDGIATSSTLMANGPAFDDAVEIAKPTSLPIGCHVVLVDGRPLLRDDRIASLLGKRAGQFDDSLTSLALRAIGGRLDSGQIEAEITAQIRKLQGAGIAVTHLDAHKHTHILPQVLRPMLQAAKACGVRAVRNPFGPLRFSMLVARPRLWKQYSKVKLLQSMASRFRRAVAKHGLLTTDGTVGIVATGSLDERLFRHTIETLPDGTWEFVCHPGYNDAELDRVRTRLRESREHELKLLTSTWARELLANEGIELISYEELG
jgi:hopanoid biosynthesis associated protein HpnK